MVYSGRIKKLLAPNHDDGIQSRHRNWNQAVFTFRNVVWKGEKRMKGKIFCFTAAILVALLASVWAADVTGKWMAQAPGNQGNVDITLNFKVDGTTLTGTVDNPQAGPADIKDGKVNGERNFLSRCAQRLAKTTRRLCGKAKSPGMKSGLPVRLKAGRWVGAGAAPALEIIAKRVK